MRLRISAVIRAPREQVYAYVTAYGPAGPTDPAAFQQKYGRILEQSGNTYTVQDEKGEEEERLRWRCTFETPSRRVMEALDSHWADRTDTFQEVPGATRWTITWHPKSRGLVGLLQWAFFAVRGGGRARRQVMAPVEQHFREERR
ncbi:MAG: hypothetical protein HY686_09435 [Chloroflexi bacterium]|nr:hypothetical protein [Chloroflexota bacterium]